MDTAPTWASTVKIAKRDLLLQAARDEFFDKGLEGATMRGIALRAGCTTGAVYPLFDSKEALYTALLEQSLTRLDAAVAVAVATTQDDAPARARAACSAFVGYYLLHPFEVNLGLYAFRGLKRQGVGGDADRALNDALARVLDRIAQPLALARGVSVPPVQPLVALLFSQMIGAMVLHLAGRLDALATDPHALLRQQLDLLLPATDTPIPTHTDPRSN